MRFHLCLEYYFNSIHEMHSAGLITLITVLIVVLSVEHSCKLCDYGYTATCVVISSEVISEFVLVVQYPLMSSQRLNRAGTFL